MQWPGVGFASAIHFVFEKSEKHRNAIIIQSSLERCFWSQSLIDAFVPAERCEIYKQYHDVFK